MTIIQRAGWYIVSPGVTLTLDPRNPASEGSRVYLPSAALAAQLQMLGLVHPEGQDPAPVQVPLLIWRGCGGSTLWTNDTGADVAAGTPMDLGGVYGFAVSDIPAGEEKELALAGVWDLPLPDGLNPSAGDLIFVDGGVLSDSGVPVGVVVEDADAAGRRVRVHLLPGTGSGGGGGGTSDNVWKPAVSAEGVITWTRSASTTPPPAQNIKGQPGANGVSPEVVVDDITGGHRITITDATHPQGQTFDVLDGQGGGDAYTKAETDALVASKVFVATYNVTTSQQLIAYLDSAKEPFAPILVKRGNDYYTAALATKSGNDSVIVRVMGSGSGDYIIFNYTVTGAVWASSSYIFQKKLESGVSIKTINNQSLLGSGNIDISGGGAQYELCDNDTGGNVVQKGEIVIGGTTYGLFEFYYKTGLLPAANATVEYSLANLLASYTIQGFIDATGMTEDGVFIGNGRTDNDNRLIVQQFSKNNKNVTIRAYKDFSTKTATLKILFIGTKN